MRQRQVAAQFIHDLRLNVSSATVLVVSVNAIRQRPRRKGENFEYDKSLDFCNLLRLSSHGSIVECIQQSSALTPMNTSVDMYLHKRLMPVQGLIPYLAGRRRISACQTEYLSIIESGGDCGKHGHGNRYGIREL
jgi:hypothetical protein